MNRIFRDTTCLIIGGGTIGTSLKQRLELGGADVQIFGASRETVDQPLLFRPKYRQACRTSHFVFIAIPTRDDGSIALQLILDAAKRKTPVITCEKGALANHFEMLYPHLDYIGYNATVGGGSGIIDIIRSRCTDQTETVHVILNGTTNYIWSRLHVGIPLGQAVEEAKQLHYIEPGECVDPVAAIGQEVWKDAVAKAAILLNLGVDPGWIVTPQDFNIETAPDCLIRNIQRAREKRFIVSFSRQKDFEAQIPTEDTVFRIHDNGWCLIGGFRSLHDPLIARLCEATQGADNGVLIIEGANGEDGVYLHVGPGAGAAPTVAAMLRDAKRLYDRSP